MRSDGAGADALASLGAAGLLLAAIGLPLAAFTWLGGVGLAAPLGLALAGVAGPLLLLHVLKSRRPRRTVGSLLLWRVVAREQRATRPFKRLRRNLVLALQLLVLASLAYGLARPVVQAAARGRARIVVLDTSASMLARDGPGGVTRFAAARAEALELVSSLGPGEVAAVIAADRTAWIAVPWTDDAAALARGVEALEARHTGTDLDEALLLAAEAAGDEGAEVHLLSDGGGPAPRAVELGGPLRYRPFGERADNLGLARAVLQPRVGRGGDGEGVGYEAFVSVENAGPRPAEAFVGIERGGRLLAARRIRVPGETALPVVLEARLEPGPIAVRLLPPAGEGPLDPLPVDDAAFALVPEERGVRVALLGRAPSPALERALTAAGARVAALGPDEAADAAARLVVCEEVVPSALPPGDCLLVAPERAVGPVAPGDLVERPRVAGWDREDPLLEYVDLAGLEVRRARALRLGPGARALLQGVDPATGEPVVLIAAWRDGSAARVVVGFDVYESTWPLRASFPIFVRNAVVEASRRDELARGGLRAGTPLSIPVGPGVASVTVEAPDGRATEVPVRGGEAVFAATDVVGVYRVRAGERTSRFCVNLGDPAESRIAPRQTLRVGDEAVSAGGAAATRPLEVGWWFALAGLLLLTLEAWVYHRRW